MRAGGFGKRDVFFFFCILMVFCLSRSGRHKCCLSGCRPGLVYVKRTGFVGGDGGDDGVSDVGGVGVDGVGVGVGVGLSLLLVLLVQTRRFLQRALSCVCAVLFCFVLFNLFALPLTVLLLESFGLKLHFSDFESRLLELSSGVCHSQARR